MGKVAPYTKAEQDALDHLAHMARFGWVALTGRRIPKRSMLRLEKRGLVRDAGLVMMVDGDGFALQPERYRQGWELTDAGKAEIKRLDSLPRLPNGYVDC